jgi:hypothetical protein
VGRGVGCDVGEGVETGAEVGEAAISSGVVAVGEGAVGRGVSAIVGAEVAVAIVLTEVEVTKPGVMEAGASAVRRETVLGVQAERQRANKQYTSSISCRRFLRSWPNPLIKVSIYSARAGRVSGASHPGTRMR